MAVYEYNIEVTTGTMFHAGTFDNLYVNLIGTEGQSDRMKLSGIGFGLLPGWTQSCTVTMLFSIGSLLLLQLEKNLPFQFLEDEWYCSKVVVTTPDNNVITFPCLRWMSRGEIVVLRGGRATIGFEDNNPKLREQRRNELLTKQHLYQWGLSAQGLPYILNVTNPKALPSEMTFLLPKAFEFQFTRNARSAEMSLKGLAGSKEPWGSLDSMEILFNLYKTPISGYVIDHWRDDHFFGYQFLNGANPTVIQRCSELPVNFYVTEEMVKPFLANGSSLAAEMKKGNIFICDYWRLQGLPTAWTGGKPGFMAAAFCLLYLTPEHKLIPIAIQLGRTPGVTTPVFLPSDSEYDWLLAKLFVRHADVLHHGFVDHLLKTHFLAEVFTLATLRNLPSIHPLNKLLMPHHRDTLYINVIGRVLLVGPGRILENSTLETEGSNELMRRALSETTYSSLCPPEDMEERGLGSVPNFYYRDDGLRLWNITKRFVKAIVDHYYLSDGMVTMDSELQAWIRDIFTYGFLSNINSGIPQRFQTVEEVIKFITMVIYTSSVQHAAVNNGQFDYLAWPANGPIILCKEPPSTKGQSTLQTVLETLPLKGISSRILSIAWLLTRKYTGSGRLGSYPDERFVEPVPQRIIKDFQLELSRLSKAIAQRNSELPLPYTYLDPTQIENSVAI